MSYQVLRNNALTSSFLHRRTDNSAAARHYANLRTALEQHGEPMGNLDLMIAAQALAAGVILVSNDRVFRRVKGLTVEDWSRP